MSEAREQSLASATSCSPDAMSRDCRNAAPAFPAYFPNVASCASLLRDDHQRTSVAQVVDLAGALLVESIS
jgi:hypothetical protein